MVSLIPKRAPTIPADFLLDQLVAMRLLDLVDLRGRALAPTQIEDLVGTDVVLVGPQIGRPDIKGSICKRDSYGVTLNGREFALENDILIVDFASAPPEPPHTHRLLARPGDGAITGIVVALAPQGLNSRIALAVCDLQKRLQYHLDRDLAHLTRFLIPNREEIQPPRVGGFLLPGQRPG